MSERRRLAGIVVLACMAAPSCGSRAVTLAEASGETRGEFGSGEPPAGEEPATGVTGFGGTGPGAAALPASGSQLGPGGDVGSGAVDKPAGSVGNRKPFKLGFSVVDAASASAIPGLSKESFSSDGERRIAEMNALIAYANATGGVQGRPIVGVANRMGAEDLNDGPRQAKCIAMTEDHQVEAYIDANGFASEEDFACMANHKVVYVGAQVTLDRHQLRRFQPYINTTFAAVDRLGGALIEGGHRIGFFKEQKVGIVLDDTPSLHRVYDTVVKPALVRAGVSDPEVFFITPYPNEGPQGAQASSAVLQFREAGVTRVGVIGNLLTFLSFSQTAASQRYHPRYIVGDYQVLAPAVFTAGQTGNMEGAVGVSSIRYVILDEAVSRPAAASRNYDRRTARGGFKRCLDVMSKYMKMDYYHSSSGRSAGMGEYCENFFLWLDAVRAAPAPMNPQNWARGQSRLAHSYQSYFLGRTWFAPGLHDGGYDYRVGQFVEDSVACGCFQAAKPDWFKIPT